MKIRRLIRKMRIYLELKWLRKNGVDVDRHNLPIGYIGVWAIRCSLGMSDWEKAERELLTRESIRERSLIEKYYKIAKAEDGIRNNMQSRGEA